MKTALTVGVFDLFHYGHLGLFRRAKEAAGQNGKLIVAIQDDNFVRKYKPDTVLIYPFEVRKKLIKSLRFVDEVISYQDVDTIVQNVKFDIFVVGGDQTHTGFMRAIEYCQKNGIEVVRLPRTEGISTSELKERIKSLK